MVRTFTVPPPNAPSIKGISNVSSRYYDPQWIKILQYGLLSSGVSDPLEEDVDNLVHAEAPKIKARRRLATSPY